MTVSQGTTNDMVLRSDVPLGSYLSRIGDALVRRAVEHPERVHLAERAPDGGWRTLTFGEQLQRVRKVAAGLLAAGALPERPVAILSENSVDFGTLVLACMHAGVPSVPLSIGYARRGASPERLRALLDVVTPSLAFAPGAGARELLGQADPALAVVSDIAELRSNDVRAADAAFDRTGPDTLAKILFTSGSTGTPKGVMITQRMMCANQKMLALAWPEVVDEPTLLDWAPWSHVASGNKIFNLSVVGGGTLYIDEGKPVAGAFERTLRNLRDVAPTFFFNVPRGYEMLVDALEADDALAAHFFSRMRRIFSAGASLPERVRERLSVLARRHSDREIPVVTSWGATETAPMATAIWGPEPAELQTIGTPIPGLDLKLARIEDRFEIRIKGPTVTPGYFRNPAASAAAFDDEGYYRSGDAAELFDPGDPSRGLVFKGRIGENFKLLSGTWVNVGAVRLSLLEVGEGLIDDAVICGADQDELSALIFLNVSRAREAAGAPDADLARLAVHAVVRERIAHALVKHNAAGGGNSTRVERALVLTDPPRVTEGELTDKGTINQRRSQALRPEAVAALYSTLASEEILVCS